MLALTREEIFNAVSLADRSNAAHLSRHEYGTQNPGGGDATSRAKMSGTDGKTGEMGYPSVSRIVPLPALAMVLNGKCAAFRRKIISQTADDASYEQM